MAHFLQKPGSAGKWTEATMSLTVNLGETAEILLAGGGPPGKELLDVGVMGEPTPACEELDPVGNRRFFRIAPRAASRLWVVAKLPGTEVDYAEPVSLIALPRKASALGTEDVILFSQDPGEWREIGAVYRRAVDSTPPKEVVVAESFGDFVQFLTRFRDAGRRIGKLEFFTHGCPGVVALGNDNLTAAHVRSLTGKGFDTVFAPDARVYFSGCNIAAEYKGVAFMMEFGRAFLFHGGGSVAGCTTRGAAYGDFGGGKIYHTEGGVRRLYFNTLGKVVKWEGMDDIDFSCITVGP